MLDRELDDLFFAAEPEEPFEPELLEREREDDEPEPLLADFVREEPLLFEAVDRDDPLFADFRDDPPLFDEPLLFDVRDDPLLFEEPPLFDDPPLLAVFDRDELPLLAELLDPLFEDDEVVRDELFLDPDFDDEVGDLLTAERPAPPVCVPAADAAAPSTAPAAAPLRASLIRSFALSYIVWIVPFCFAIVLSAPCLKFENKRTI